MGIDLSTYLTIEPFPTIFEKEGDEINVGEEFVVRLRVWNTNSEGLVYKSPSVRLDDSEFVEVLSRREYADDVDLREGYHTFTFRCRAKKAIEESLPSWLPPNFVPELLGKVTVKAQAHWTIEKSVVKTAQTAVMISR